MKLLTRSLAAAALLALPAMTLADEQQQDLEARVAALETMLAEASKPAPEKDPAEVTFLTGYDKGFFIESADGNNLLKANAITQIRYIYGHADRNTNAPEDTSGFEIARTRLTLSGHAIDPRIFYYLQGGFSSSGGDFDLIDLFVGYRLNDNIQLRIGQWKHQFQRETFLSLSKLSAVDKSLVASGILPAKLGRIQGIEAQYRDDLHRVVITLNEGYKSYNTSLTDETSDAGITGRYEFKPFGEWKYLADFSAHPGDPTGLLIAIAGHAEEGSAFAGTADITFQTDAGTNVFASIAWHEIDDAEAWGSVLQVAQFVADNIEPFLRYEFGQSSGASDLSVITVGSNVYFFKGNVKITGDLGYAFDAVSGTFDKSSIGWMTDDPGSDGQIVFRLQLQLKL
ncbi:MAG: porin [Phycisphaeraceae bacterium]